MSRAVPSASSLRGGFRLYAYARRLLFSEPLPLEKEPSKVEIKKKRITLFQQLTFLADYLEKTGKVLRLISATYFLKNHKGATGFIAIFIDLSLHSTGIFNKIW